MSTSISESGVQPGALCAVVVGGVPRPGQVLRVRDARAYVKYEDGAALYRCAWVAVSELRPG